MIGVVEATVRSFEQEVLKSDVPVLVDFWAVWCAPCKALSPILEEVATELGLKVAKINVEENMSIATTYQVVNVPTLMLFVDGQPVKLVAGRTKRQLLKELAELV